MTSPALYKGTRLPVDLSAVRPDDVEIGGADGRNWAGISRSDDPTGKSLADFQNPLSSPFRKNISVFPKSKSGYMIRYPASLEGRFAIVTDARRDAVDAAVLPDERHSIRLRQGFGGRVPNPLTALA